MKGGTARDRFVLNDCFSWIEQHNFNLLNKEIKVLYFFIYPPFYTFLNDY